MRPKEPTVNRLPPPILETLPLAAFGPLLAVVFDRFNIADGKVQFFAQPVAKLAKGVECVEPLGFPASVHAGLFSGAA